METRASGISRGTEALVFKSHVPENQYATMRCPFQDGEFPAPVKYGYANVGVVAGSSKRVFCLYPHQDRYVVPAEAVISIPDDVPNRRAVLAANMETAVNAMWDAAPHIGDRIAVVGGGVVGTLVATLCGRLPGTSVTLIDVNPAREKTARKMGVEFALPEEAQGDCDLVIHASGSPSGLATALGLAGFEATVLEISWYGDQVVPLPLGEAFHARRLRIRSSQVGSVAPSRRARHSGQDRLKLALSLLRDPVFDNLISGSSPFDELPATMTRLARAPGEALCHVVTYS